MQELQVKLVREGAKLPVRATDGSAGADLHACIAEPLTIPAHGHALVGTGIAINLESSDVAAFVFARSGLAIKHGLGLLNAVGVIDSDYRGEISVGLVNQFAQDYTIQPGERIAQLVLLPVLTPQIVQVQQLAQTQRGAGGFGSTGK